MQLKNVLNQGYEILDQNILANKPAEIEKMKQPILYLENLMVKLHHFLKGPMSQH